FQFVDVDIGCNVDVRSAVVIVIAESRSGMPGDFAAQSGLRSDFRERAIAVVSEQQIEADVCDQDIRESIVIEIPNSNTCTPVRVAKSGSSSHIFEGAVGPIVVQIDAACAGRRYAASEDLAKVSHCRTIDDEQVH